MKTNNTRFKIADKTKILFKNIYNLTENVPRKDYFLKENIRNETYDLLKKIYIANSIKSDYQKNIKNIKISISLIDYLLEVLYTKKYISLKQLEKETFILSEINAMTTSWINNMENKDVK